MKKIYILLSFVLLGYSNTNAQVNLNLGLIAHYNFTGQSLLDLGPNFITLFNNNNATPVPDRFGNPDGAYSFDGFDDYLSAANDPILTLGYGATISLWVNLNNVTNNQKLIGKLTTPPITTDGGYLIGIENGEISVETWVIGSATYTLTAGNIVANQWTHIAVTFQSTNYVTLNINAVAIDSVYVPDALDANSNDLIIGAAPWDPNYFKTNGIIDDIRLYNRKINNAELNAIYNEVITSNKNLVNNEITIGRNGSIYTINGGSQKQINKITLTDLSGRIVYNEIVNNTQSNQLDLSNLTKGVYLATVHTNSGEKSFKIIH
jgi:hypothetical protein